MKQFDFRFPDRAAALTALAAFFDDVVDPDTGEVVNTYGHVFGIDAIGPIPDKIDEDGNVVKAGDSRYHVNVRVGTPELEAIAEAAWEAHGIEPPETPYRVFL